MRKDENVLRALIFFGYVSLMGVIFVYQRSDAAREKHYPQVMLIRHAEDPDVEGSPDLSARGQARANALHELFEKSDKRPNPLPTPDFIFAAKDSKRSQRSRKTVEPLATHLKLHVNAEYENEDFGKLVKELHTNPRYTGKTILIAWHHGTATDFADKLGASDAPKWKDAVYDRVWHITYDGTGKATLHDLPQRLLEKDSDK